MATSSTKNAQVREAERLDAQRRARERASSAASALESSSKEQREEIQETFNLSDIDKDGYINYSGAWAVAGERQQAEVGKFAGPPQRLLSFQAFQTVMAQKIVGRDLQDKINRAFDLFDSDSKGSITLQDLARVTKELGEGLQNEELHAMIEKFDTNGYGAISREKFINICLG